MTHPSESRRLTITLIEPEATIDGRLDSAPARDLYSLVRLPARGVDLLAAVARKAGFADAVAYTPRYFPKGRLGDTHWQRLAQSDLVGISVITRTAPTAYELAARVRAINPGAVILLGGPHPTALPEESLRHADLVALHEGDATLVEVLERLAEHRERPDFSGVRGLAYLRDGAMHFTEKRAFLTDDELSALPFPVYPREVLRGLTHQCINTSRGCPFACEYCSVIENFGRAFRVVSEDRVMELLRHQLAQTQKPIFFGDDIFTANKRRTKSLMERILSEHLKLPSWSAQVRVESARDEDLLALMRRAGCERVYIGLESINQQTLDEWNKHATVEANTQAIERYHAHRIQVHGMFVIGSETDTPETVRQTVVYAKKLRLDTAQFFSITPLPGPPLTRLYEEQGKILTRDWHLYDALHVVAQPALMSARRLQQELNRAHQRFYSWWEAAKFFVRGPKRAFNGGIRLLGHRLARRVQKDSRAHSEALERLEHWQQQAETALKALADLYERAGERSARLLSRKTGCAERHRGAREDGIARQKPANAGAPAVPGVAAESPATLKAAYDEACATLQAAYDEACTTLKTAYEHLADEYRPFCRQFMERWKGQVQGWIASLQTG